MGSNTQILEFKKNLSAESQKENPDNNVIFSLLEQIKKLEQQLIDPNAKNKIPFKVSARTARLIGRENIANAKGAIIELVKNSYDADSKVCIVYFDNKYSTFLSEINDSHFQNLIKLGVSEELLKGIYLRQESEENYILNNAIDDEKKILFKNLISKLASLYIIDFGEGMTQDIIRNHWMTIGTDNKANDIFTKHGRDRKSVV